MAVYKTKCGRHFIRSNNGTSYYMGESWGEEYGKETTHCYDELKKECEFCRRFREKYPSELIGDCDGVLVDDSEYDYENSLDKIRDDYTKKSYDKITAKFGCNCMAISIDGKGGYTIRRDETSCRHCWNSICVITNKKRDLTKVRIMADLEYRWVDKIGGLFEEEKKNLTRKRVTDLIPLDYAERVLRDKNSEELMRFETNNCRRTSQVLGFEPTPTILRYYIQKSTAKRDLLEDLKAIEEGYTVIHESDAIKEKAQKKREKKVKKEETKARKIKEYKARAKIKQISFFEG